MIKELRKDFHENGITNFEVNDVAYLFNRIAELDESNDRLGRMMAGLMQQSYDQRQRNAELEADIKEAMEWNWMDENFEAWPEEMHRLADKYWDKPLRREVNDE